VRGGGKKMLNEIAFFLFGRRLRAFACQSRLCLRAAAREMRSRPCA
jgi:hypothetical protein